MTTLAGPLYEASYFVEQKIVADFDLWLEEQVQKSLREHGFTDVRAWSGGDDNQGRAIRICQFRCLDDSMLDEFLDGDFAEIEALIGEHFGDDVEILNRILREDSLRDVAYTESPNCLNCGSRLRGQYCGSCGQRARNRLISLWELVSEAFGDLFELDSRLWRTIIPLLARPGRLTRDYLEGRRARYMPPFRMYLVLSVIFFVVAFFDPRDDLSLLFEPEPEPTPEEIATAEAQASAKKKEILDEVEAGLAEADPVLKESAAEIRQHVEASLDENDTNPAVEFGEHEDCNIEVDDLEDMPAWLQKRLTRERLQQVCERVAADNGKAFFDLLLDNIPVALIVLLPLMALVLKVLYPLSRRYFVEHLLFFVHFHAFFFLILTLQILFARLSALVRLPEAIAILAIVAASFYIPVYLYMAMRRVYGQGHILTVIKYVALVFAYAVGATLTMLSAVLFALVSV